MSRYYNMAGEEVGFGEGMRLFSDAFNKERQVGHEKRGDILVSTVLLVIDHSFGKGQPLIFETMIFGGEHDDYQERYSTRAEAEAGHARACALAFGEDD